ncbi:MAG: YdeI/OmpD-associated family protein [Solirubrobacteraceae bacterium]
MGEISLQGKLVARGPAAAFVLGDEQVAIVGEGAKRFPVIAIVNGYTWRTSVTRMDGEFLVGLSREVRTGAGVEAGDPVTLELKLDTEPRTINVPPALAEALDKDPAAKAAFDGLAFTHRKEFARGIEEAKREETRARRVTQALDMIRTGRTRS